MTSRIVLSLAGNSSDCSLDPVEADKNSKQGGEFALRLSNAGTRRPIKRNALARGLAREYDAQKAREDAYKARLSRELEQLKNAQSFAKDDSFNGRSRSPERDKESQSGSNSDADLGGSDVEHDGNENGVILRVRPLPKPSSDKRQYSGGDKWRTSSRSRTLVVPVKHGLGMSRKAGLRCDVALLTNQSDESVSNVTELSWASPVIPRSSYQGPEGVWSAKSPAASSRSHHGQSPSGIDAGVGGSMAHWRPDRSSALVLCELRITKEILAREQALRQLGEATAAFDSVAMELIDAVEAKKAAEAAAGSSAARMIRFRRESSSSVILQRPESGSQAQSNSTALAALKQNVEALSTIVDKLTERIRQRMKQIALLLESMREATTAIVEGVSEWRGLRRRRRGFSNFDPLLRFPWKNGKVANYLLHLQADTRGLFSSTAVMCLIGADTEYNALLLPRSVLSTLNQEHAEAGRGAALPSKTFLTDKIASTGVATDTLGIRALDSVPGVDQHLYYALMTALQGLRVAPADTAEQSEQPTPYDLARWCLCLENIARELELETRDSERCGQDAERLQHSYNPFVSIKAVGGVDEQLSALLAEQSPHVEKLRQRLRHRQQDVTDYNASADARDSRSASVKKEHAGAEVSMARGTRCLQVSSQRLSRELQRRRDIREAAMQCEVRDALVDCASEASVATKRSRLQGGVLARKQPVPTTSREDRLASIIQRQFRAYRARGSVLQRLAGLVELVRASTVDIQRVYRGHMVKQRFEAVLSRRNELRRSRTRAARIIVLFFRRYKRRQRHRQSVTVVAIAQAQLQSIIVSKSHDDDAAAMKREETERLRRLGADRRRYVAAMMEQQRREQLALEAERTAAAVRIQSVVRSQQALRTASELRQEKKAHLAAVSAITIQSNIRAFLVRQEARRLRFRKDLARVNRSAARIQQVYRDYNQRAHQTAMVEEGDETDDDERESHKAGEEDQWDGKLPPLLQVSASQTDPKNGPPTTERVALPPLTRPTASTASRRPSRQLVTSPTPSAVAMTRIELKLKEPVIDFQGVSTGLTLARRGFFQGWHGRA